MTTSLLDLPTPVAPRLRRPGWRDPRLLAGIAMVAASVALGSWVVRTAQRTVPVYVAREALVPGEVLDAGSLVAVDVRLGTVDDGRYLSAGEALPDGATVLRTVQAGELVPRSAVGAADDVDVRPVAVTLAHPPAKGVTAGAVVDLWFSPAVQAARDDADAQPVEPREVVAGLTVAEVSRPEGAFAAAGSATVQVLVPRDSLATVLAVLAQDGVVDVVPLPGSGG